MARKLKEGKMEFPPMAHYGWRESNREPYDYLIAHLCKDKSSDECAKIIQDVQDSFVYLAICEIGAEITVEVIKAYEIEQKDGLFGAMYFLMKKDPRFRIAYENYEYSKEHPNSQD